MYESTGLLYPGRHPFAPARSFDCWIEDVDGNLFLDLTGMAGVAILGHNAQPMEEFLSCANRLMTTLDFPTDDRVALLRDLSECVDQYFEGGAKIHLTAPTGSDAVEAALKLSRFLTKRDAILAFENSYHGTSIGAAAVSDLPKPKLVASTVPTFFAPYPYCYRCPLGLTHPSCRLECIGEVEKAIELARAQKSTIAAAIIEPVQGEGGTIPAPEGYLDQLHTVLKKRGILLIVDEIQTGFGRTGKLFACGHSNLQPDIMTFSKGASGVGAPLAGIAFRRALDGWPAGSHVGTFRGFVPAFAAARRTLEILVKSAILDDVNALSAGATALAKEKLSGCPNVGDIRSRGLMFGIEVVKDCVTRAPFPQLASQILRHLFLAGILVELGGACENVIRLLPPLNVDSEVLAFGIESIAQAFSACSSTL